MLDAWRVGVVSTVMIRRALLVLAVLAAASAHAYDEPRFTPKHARIKVGETFTFRANVVHLSGISIYGFRYRFEADDPGIADVDGLVEYPRWSADVTVLGTSIGTTTIRTRTLPHLVLATVEVYCDDVPVVTREHRTAKLGTPVTLTAPPGQIFTWYAGRTGDISRPLYTGGILFNYVPDRVGTQVVWVAASTSCATSYGEFEIDVTPSRVRAVRR